MKYLIAAALFALTIVDFSASAEAAQGCGPGYARGPYGRCRPMGSVVVVRRPPVVVVAPRGCPRGFAWRAGRCRPF